MKILKPIPSSEVPEGPRRGRARNKDYDKLIAQAQKIAMSKTLPVECEDLTKAQTLYAALRSRIKADSLKLNVFKIGNTIYMERVK